MPEKCLGFWNQCQSGDLRDEECDGFELIILLFLRFMQFFIMEMKDKD